MMSNKKNRLTLTYLLELSGVSKSGYYGFIEPTNTKLLNEFKDEEDFELIMKAYRFKGFNKGAKQLKMTLENHFDTVMNLKKIRRLMKKFGLFCPIRKANPYKRMAKAMKTSHVAPNKLERKFKEGNPNQILLTDITYLTYDLNQRAY
jgi:putative transposase